MAQNGTDVDSGNINIGGNGGNINIGGNGGIGTDFDGGEGRPVTFSVSTPLPSSVNLSQCHITVGGTSRSRSVLLVIRSGVKWPDLSD